MASTSNKVSTRKRNSNWTKEQTLLLMNLVKENKRIIRGKFSDGITSRAKIETWQNIKQQINAAFPYVSRNVEQVQKRYHNIISLGKNKIAAQKRLFCKIAGGRPLEKKQLLDPLSEAVADMMCADNPSIFGISGLGSNDSVVDEDIWEDNRTCTIVAPHRQSTSDESLPETQLPEHVSEIIFNGVEDVAHQKRVKDLKIKALKDKVIFYSAQMEASKAQMEAYKAKMEACQAEMAMLKTQIDLAKLQVEGYSSL